MRGNSLIRTYLFKKRYAYLVDEKLRIFQRIQGQHSGFSRSAWAAIITSVCTVFLSTFIGDVNISVLRFFYIIN